MRRTGKFNYTEIPQIDSKLLEIPYSGDDISLYVVLPNQRQGLKKLKTTLTDFTAIESGISDHKEEQVVVMIAKIKLQTSYSMKDTLIELGMNSVFNNSADLSGIDGQKDLVVTNVNKACILTPLKKFQANP